VNELIVANCGCTINGSRADADINNPTLPEDHYGTIRVLARNGAGDRVETGLYKTNGARFSPCDFTGALLKSYWAWKDGSNYHCGINAGASSGVKYTIQVRRTTTSSSNWAMILDGNTIQTSGTLFGAPANIYAGGALNYETSGTNIHGSYGCDGSILWSRTNDALNQTASWTAIGSSSQIIEGHWGVDAPVNCFAATNTF